LGDYKNKFIDYINKQKKIELNNYGIKVNSFLEIEKMVLLPSDTFNVFTAISNCNISVLLNLL
jgi:hypothetical protein